MADISDATYRCRGSDLQLHRNAVGLLTLGPSTLKDKLMQAAGRLRMLGRGQRLHLAATHDVVSKICSLTQTQIDLPLLAEGYHLVSPSVGPHHVLQWIMHNTVQASLSGIVEWASQGLYFARTKEDISNAFQAEDPSLSSLYGQARQLEPVSQVLQRLTEEKGRQKELSLLSSQVVSKGDQLGKGHLVVVGKGINEECERELEKETETQREEEMEIDRAEPSSESDWSYKVALEATSIHSLLPLTAISFASMLERLSPDSGLHEIQWPDCIFHGIFCTPNFINTREDDGDYVDNYLRPVQHFLFFPVTQEVLLLSEREADAILEEQARLRHTEGIQSQGPILHLLSHAVPDRLSLACCLGACSRALVQTRPNVSPSVGQILTLQLFNGETEYRSRDQREILHPMMRRQEKGARAICSARGREARLHKSDLEKACSDVYSWDEA